MGKFPGEIEVVDSVVDEFDYSNLCSTHRAYMKKVIYNDPATIVIWSDGTKTVSKCHRDDVYNRETGLCIAVMKKVIGSSNVRGILDSWSSDKDGNVTVTLSDVRKKN